MSESQEINNIPVRVTRSESDMTFNQNPAFNLPITQLTCLMDTKMIMITDGF